MRTHKRDFLSLFQETVDARNAYLELALRLLQDFPEIEKIVRDGKEQRNLWRRLQRGEIENEM